MGATSNLDFAVANVIMGVEKFSPHLVDNYIIFYDEKDKFKTESIFKNISEKIEFRPINTYKIPANISFYERYSKLYLAKYFIFDLLKEYDKVLWLDADICIQGDISGIFSYGPMAWRPTVVSMKTKLEKLYDIPESATAPNGGVILVTRDIDGYERYTDEIIELCNELMEKYEKPNVDELAFGLLAYRNNIKVDLLPDTYNAGCSWPCAFDAKIVHSIGPKKFWNSPENYFVFSHWKENNEIWKQKGGGDKVSIDLSSYKKSKFIIYLNYYWYKMISKITYGQTKKKHLEARAYWKDFVNLHRMMNKKTRRNH